MFATLPADHSSLTPLRRAARQRLPAALTLAAALASGCNRQPEQGAALDRTVQVSVVTVAPRTVPNVLEFIGQTDAYQTVEIRSRVAGFLVKQNYVDGDKVKEGQVLFEIDPKPFQAQVDVNKAQVAQAKARLANAKSELARQKQLLEAKASSQKDYDTAETMELTTAAEVELQEASLVVAELDLSYTRIVSPVTGRAGRRLLDVGSYISVGPNALLTTCQQTDPISAYFTISERDILRFREQVQKQLLVLPADGAIAVQLVLVDGSVYDKVGKIDFRDIRIDPTTGTAKMRAQFPNPDEVLKPGMFVKCRGLGIERPNSLVVPQRCVLQSPAGAVVYVIGEDGAVQVKPVKLGPWVGQDWLIEEGLNAGDRVVDDNLLKVQPGSKVEIVAAAVKPAASETPPAESNQSKPAKPAEIEK